MRTKAQTIEIAKKQLEPILVDVSWRNIAQEYFGKSSSWIYNKLKGIDGNGLPTDFSDEEKETLRLALYELSDRIRKSAESFK